MFDPGHLKAFIFSPLDPDSGSHSSTPKITYGNGLEQSIYIEELKKVNEELRQARRAALNLMEDAILSKEALRVNEARMRRQKEAFQAAVNGAPLHESLNIIASLVTDESKGRTAFYMADTEGKHLHPVWGAGNMPQDYLKEIDGFLIGKDSLACGLAVPTGQAILTADVLEEPRWKPWTSIAEKYDYRGCWSFPVKTLEDKAIGAFAIYFSEPREATQTDIELAEIVTQTAAVIIFNYSEAQKRKEAEEALRKSEERKEFLLKLNDGLRELNDPAEIEYEAARLVAEKLEADRAHFAELSEDEKLVIRKDYIRGDAPSIAGVTEKKVVAAALKLERDEPVVIPDVEAFHLLTEEEKAILAAAKIRSQLSVALSKKGKKVASFSVDQTTPREWKPFEISILQEAAERTLAAVEKAKAEKALQQSENRLRTLADAVPQVIWTNNEEGKANYFNKGWYEYSRLSYEQSAGLGWEAIVHPEDAPASKEKWQQAQAAGKIFDTEYRLRRHDGVYRWFIGRNVPLKNEAGKVTGWFGSATDINDLKEIQEALSQSEARLRVTTESAVDYAIITMDSELRIERWSSGASQIFGYTEAEVIGKSLDIIFTDEDREAGTPQQEMETARDTGRAVDERWHIRKDGSRFFVSGVMRPIQNNHLTGYVKVLRDITQQQLFTEELHRLVAERTVELQRSNDDLRQFAHVASHDLKEPVRKIKTFNNRIIDDFSDALPGKVKTYLRKIGDSADRMFAMIEGVLNFSKAGSSNQAVEAVDLNQIISEIKNDLEVLMQQKNGQITFINLPQLLGYPVLLYQLFYNLILNSLKFSKSNEPPIININCRLVKQDEKNFYKIELEDNGIGFEHEYAEAIFGTFARLHSIDEYEGTGLGLALCKKIVERHGGSIWANGEPGKGAIFTIMLPAQ